MKKVTNTPLKVIPTLYNLTGKVWLTPVQCELLQSNLNQLHKEIDLLPPGILASLGIDRSALRLEINKLNNHMQNRTFPKIKSSSTRPEGEKSNDLWEKIALCSSCLTIGGCLCEAHSHITKPLDRKSREYQKKHEPSPSFEARDFRFGNNLISKLTRRLNSDKVVLKIKGPTPQAADSILPHEILRDKFISYQDVAMHRSISLPHERDNIWPHDGDHLQQFDSNLIIPRSWEANEQVMDLCRQIIELHDLPVKMGPNGFLPEIGLKLAQALSHCEGLAIPL